MLSTWFTILELQYYNVKRKTKIKLLIVPDSLFGEKPLSKWGRGKPQTSSIKTYIWTGIQPHCPEGEGLAYSHYPTGLAYSHFSWETCKQIIFWTGILPLSPLTQYTQHILTLAWTGIQPQVPSDQNSWTGIQPLSEDPSVNVNVCLDPSLEFPLENLDVIHTS